MPFRLINDDQQFKKWQIIEAVVEKARDDNRPESHHVKVDTIRKDGPPLSTKNGWADRWVRISKVPIFDDFAAVEEARQAGGGTLALLRPSEVVDVEIAPATSPHWTPQDRDHSRKVARKHCLRFIVLRGSKFRYRSACPISYRLDTKLEEENLPSMEAT